MPIYLDSNCVTMGFEASQSKLRGPLYLITRDSSPYCGKSRSSI